MSYALVFTESYNRRAARWLKRHPDARQQYLKTLQLLQANPFHPSLRLHALSGTPLADTGLKRRGISLFHGADKGLS